MSQTFIPIKIANSAIAAEMSPWLISERSCCHTWEPLPDDEWELRVKPEQVHIVKKWLKEHGQPVDSE